MAYTGFKKSFIWKVYLENAIRTSNPQLRTEKENRTAKDNSSQCWDGSKQLSVQAKCKGSL